MVQSKDAYLSDNCIECLVPLERNYSRESNNGSYCVSLNEIFHKRC